MNNVTVDKKVRATKTCNDGKHTFMPAVWKVTPTARTCTLFVCQHCLMSVDKTEVECAIKNHHEKIEKMAVPDES